MEKITKNIFETDEFIFYHTISELSYIEKSIKLIDTNLTKSIIDLEEENQAKLLSEYKKNNYGLKFEEYKLTFASHYDNTDSILSTINESILIKTYTIFEKAIIRFAYEIQHYYKCKIAPDFNIKLNYTNIVSAKEYIKLLSDFDISKILYWQNIMKIRDIRNRLSHGNTYLNFKQNEADSINNLFLKYFNEEKIVLLEYVESNGIHNVYRITNNIKVLYIIRKLIVKTIIAIDEYYTGIRIKDDRFTLNPYLYGDVDIKDFLSKTK